MTIMYVDDSGTFNYTNISKYFILSGIIVDHGKLIDLRKTACEYQQVNFTGELIDAEIHVHDIYRSRDEFSSIDLATKIKLLNNLYDMISKLDCTGILVIINKDRLRVENSTYTPFEKALYSILEKYRSFLDENSIKQGYLKIDKSYSKMQDATLKITHRMNKYWIATKQKSTIAQPIFVDSASTYGVQIADALAYCALKHKMNDIRFSRFWNLMEEILWKSKSGAVSGYGYNEFPS